jgi:hypothetical protein
MVIFKTNATHYRPVMGHDVYTVYVDDKHDLHSIVNQVDLLVGNEVQVALAAHMIPRPERIKPLRFCNVCADTLTGADTRGSICTPCAAQAIMELGR